MNNFVRLITDKKYRFGILGYYGFYNMLPDKYYLKKSLGLKFPYVMNLEKPRTFNEKLNWIKLHDRKDLYTLLADKYEVKKFVADLIGEEYVVPNIWVGKSADDIPWEKLPEKFVIKANHDSSGASVCRNKSMIDRQSIIKKFNKIMKTNYYFDHREWPYKNIKPCIIIDEYLEDGTLEGLDIPLCDYKFWCFNGEPKFIYCTVKDTEIFENFYDMNFNPVYINHNFPRHIPEFNKPKNFNKMIELARVLAKASKTYFVRVDFFNIEGKIYFGEYTFYDWAGTRPFASKELDMELGKLIKLPID